MKRLLLLLASLPIYTISYAQLPDPGGNPDDDIETPIDSGVMILALAGAGYGVWKIKENRVKITKSSDTSTK